MQPLDPGSLKLAIIGITSNCVRSMEQHLFTEDDFETMSWHDSRIYAIAFRPEDFEFVLDIDYIVKWIEPDPEGSHYSFLIAPATLIFWNVRDLEFDISSYDTGLQLSGIKRELLGPPKNSEFVKRDKEWLWTLDCSEGEIQLKSVGFRQHLRRKPIHSNSYELPIGHRGSLFEVDIRTPLNP